jgi:hypothetical protein
MKCGCNKLKRVSLFLSAAQQGTLTIGFRSKLRPARIEDPKPQQFHPALGLATAIPLELSEPIFRDFWLLH